MNCACGGAARGECSCGVGPGTRTPAPLPDPRIQRLNEVDDPRIVRLGKNAATESNLGTGKAITGSRGRSAADVGPLSLKCEWELVSSAEGINGGAVWDKILSSIRSVPSHRYQSRLYHIRFMYPRSTGGYGVGETCFRLNVPGVVLGWESGSNKFIAPVGLAVGIAGAKGIGVWSTEKNYATYANYDDYWLGVLASGSPLTFPIFAGPTEIGVRDFGRLSPSQPMFTVAYNNPGYGDPAVQATGNPDMLLTPGNVVGDDYCGPMAVAALDCVVQAALFIIRSEAGFSASDVRVIPSSFSQGLVCMSSWAAKTKVKVHCMVDAEGPADSFDQTTVADCMADPVADPLTRQDWATCRVPEFQNHWGHWFRPPTDILYDLINQSISGCVHVPFDEAMSPPFGVYLGMPTSYFTSYRSHYEDWYNYSTTATFPVLPGTICGATSMTVPWADIGQFWSKRTPVDILGARPCAFVRINNATDHVQPERYYNKHAIKTLLAADILPGIMAGVYVADNDYVTANLTAATTTAGPTRFQRMSVDLAHPWVYPDWPQLGPIHLSRNQLRADLVRWAYGRSSF